MTKKAVAENTQDDIPLAGMMLGHKEHRYKISYAALRWAKEIKQKENLPDPIPAILPRALKEILTGQVTLKEIEKLPMMVKVAPPAQAPAQPSHPTITLNLPPEPAKEDDKEDDEEEEDEE